MITGAWDNLTLICGAKHATDDEIEMVYKQTETDLFYACPKYYPENRGEDECPCMNRISIAEAEKMLSVITDKIEAEEEAGNVFFPENYRFKTTIGEYKIKVFNDKEKRIVAFNKRAKNRQE